MSSLHSVLSGLYRSASYIGTSLGAGVSSFAPIMSGNDTSGGEEGGVGGEVSNEQQQQQQQQQLGEKRSEQGGKDSLVDMEDTSQKVKCSDGEKSTGKTPGRSKKEKAQQSRFGFLRRHHTDSPKRSK